MPAGTIYELRHYIPAAGRHAELLARFRDASIPLLPRYGIKLVRFWTEPSTGHIWYLVEWSDKDTRKAAWSRFLKSQDWADVIARTEQDGPLIERINVMFLEEPFPVKI
jgi:hypothetical protein